jgi:hypothetical protein
MTRNVRTNGAAATPPATVDAALDEVINLAARRRLMERVRSERGIGPSPEELRRLRPRE